MLKIQDKQAFQTICAHWENNDPEAYTALLKRLAYLMSYGDHETEVRLVCSTFWNPLTKQREPDPTGFDISWYRNNEFFMNGGLINHGKEWGIHT